MNRTELVLKLFNPDVNGYSRWVCKDECIGEFSNLMPTNGNTWYRNKGIGGTYNFERKEESGKIYWRFNGFIGRHKSRPIKKEIRLELLYGSPKCVHTGYGNTSGDMLIIDHKNGRYNDDNVLSIETQKIEDFQVLSNRANLAKRSDCDKCVNTGIRFDAKTLGYSKSVCSGNIIYDNTCVGCYWYDPIKFKQSI